MKMEDRVRNAFAGKAEEVEPSGDMWPAIERRAVTRRRRTPIVHALAAALILSAFVGTLVVLWGALRPGQVNDPRPLVPAGDSGPPAVDPQVTASLPIATGTNSATVAVAAGDEGIWAGVHSVHSDGGESGTLYRVDPSTNAIAAEVSVSGVSDLDVGAGSVWVAGSDIDTTQYFVERVNPESGEIVARIPLACSFEVGIGGCYVENLAATDDGVWVTLVRDPNCELVRIDPGTNEITARLPVGGWARDVVAGGGSVWVYAITETDGSTVVHGSLHRVDPATAQIATLFRDQLPPGGGVEIPPMVTFGDGAVWVNYETTGIGDGEQNVAGRVDLGTGGVEDIEMDRNFFPFAAADWAVWFTGRDTGEGGAISRLNTQTLEVDASVPVDGYVIDAALDRATNTIWAITYEGDLIRVDLT
jgi:hypothetical protein